MTNIQHQQSTLQVQDGSSMNVYAAWPDTAEKLPAIMVFQEAFGVNEHIRDLTRRIAAEGYFAVAPELFHRSAAPGFEASYSDFDSVRPHIQALTIDGLSADVQATYDFIQNQKMVDHSRVGSIGFCMGGRVSFLASTLVPLKAAACFYGGGILESLGDRIEAVQCPLLLCWGGQDKHIPKASIQGVLDKLDELGKDYVNVVFSRADHAFFCDARASYHPIAAKEAWALVKAFWQNHIV